jgi:predicted GIY-YIG superfamily endonuclease
MVKEMAERKWMDSVLLPRRQRDDFNDEYDSIVSKVAKDWLIENGYEVYDFVWDILWKLTDLRLRTKAREKGAKYATSERGLKLLKEKQEFFVRLFGDDLENAMEYEQAIRQLSKDAKIGLARDYTRFGICPDFIVKKNHDVFFVDAIANQAETKKYSSVSYRIAEEHGFKTMCLMLDVRFKVGEINLTEV